MDRIGLAGAGNNIASVKAKGAHTVVIKLKAPDSQFIAAILNRAVRRPAAHLVEGEGSRDVHEPEARRLGAVQRRSRASRRRTTSSSKNPHYWQAGLPKIACLEYVQAPSNDAALALIQSGQVDWTHNFVPNVEKAYEAKDQEHYHAFYSNRDYPVSLVFDDTQYPYSLVAVPQGAQPRDRPQLGLEARRVRLRAADRRASASAGSSRSG